ncbi:hypothetical protein G5B37_13705 [Rasiella rasia]|uniref:Integral membrane protein n=1 Tax=Rasiella rasia TaxID=2744027 RepID=A0A6G6GPV5_9FLAO|nr:hypothetical protein [Rasiella rasia]QIE60582.1 hypothetical protein G5B37_13705 [Rasiella rasia]
MDKHRNNLRIYLIIASIVWFLSLFPALFMALFSPMMFDAPGSESSTWTIAAATAMLTYPVVTVLSIVVAWLLFVRKKHKWSLCISLLPIVWIVINILIWVAIEIFCDGSFSC